MKQYDFLSGTIEKLKTPEHYQEGPWFYKRARVSIIWLMLLLVVRRG